MTPKITVVTVCYNAQNTIRQAIESVVNQDYENKEYIIIDGGSVDDTLNILQEYAGRLRYISEPDKGIYDAMNKGVKLTTGDYIEFIGADDALASNDVLTKAAKIIETDDKIDVLCAAQYLVEEKTHFERLLDCTPAIMAESGEKIMPWVPHGSMFTRRSLLLENPFDLNYQICADFDFILKCFFNPHIKMKYVDLVATYFSDGGVSSTDDEKTLAEHYKILKKYGLPAALLNKNLKNNSKIKNAIKNVFNHLGLWNKLRLMGKVRKHHCQNTVCRWCSRG